MPAGRRVLDQAHERGLAEERRLDPGHVELACRRDGRDRRARRSATVILLPVPSRHRAPRPVGRRAGPAAPTARAGSAAAADRTPPACSGAGRDAPVDRHLDVRREHRDEQRARPRARRRGGSTAGRPRPRTPARRRRSRTSSCAAMPGSAWGTISSKKPGFTKWATPAKPSSAAEPEGGRCRLRAMAHAARRLDGAEAGGLLLCAPRSTA